MILVAAAGCAPLETVPDPPPISPADLQARMDAGEPVILVCAYAAENCGGRHPEGAISLEEFEARPSSVTREQDVVFFCGCPTLETAHRRARQVRNAGWTRVHVLDGGLLGWIAAGRPLEPDTEPCPNVHVPRISWSGDLEAAKALAVESRKPLVVCYMAGWCDVCRRFRRRTLDSPRIKGSTDRFLWVELDIDRDSAAIREHGIAATPTTDLIDPWGVTRVRIPGYVNVLDFSKELEDFDAAVGSGPVDPATYQRREFDAAVLKKSTGVPTGYRAAGICFANVGYGPLRLPSLSPFQSLRFGLVPRTPSTLAEGRCEVLWTESWANLWSRDAGEHLVDFEMLQSGVMLAYGLSDVVQLEVGFLQKSRFGGSMDGFIEDFHDTFGLAQGGRDKAGRGDFALEVARRDGTPAVHLDKGDRGSFSESVLVTLQHNVTCGSRFAPALAYAFTVRKELGDQENLSEGESVDFSGSVSASKNIGHWFGYVGLGYSWFGNERFQDLDLRPSQWSGIFAVEWQCSSSASLVLQYLVSQGVAENLREFSRPSYELTLGAKVELGRVTVLEAGLIENLVTFDNSPDFGFHAGLLRRF